MPDAMPFTRSPPQVEPKPCRLDRLTPTRLLMTDSIMVCKPLASPPFWVFMYPVAKATRPLVIRLPTSTLSQKLSQARYPLAISENQLPNGLFFRLWAALSKPPILLSRS